MLIIYCFIIMRGLKISLEATSAYHSLMAFGATLMLAVQTFVIVGGVTKLIPLTGVTLPFISAGGSSLISCMMQVGILLGISSLNRQQRVRAMREGAGATGEHGGEALKMKELRRNIRIIGALMLAGILVLVVYLNYTVALNGNRWTNSTNNTRLTTARKYVIAGDIIDRNGEVLATTDSDGTRVYNSSSDIRIAVSPDGRRYAGHERHRA